MLTNYHQRNSKTKRGRGQCFRVDTAGERFLCRRAVLWEAEVLPDRGSLGTGGISPPQKAETVPAAKPGVAITGCHTPGRHLVSPKIPKGNEAAYGPSLFFFYSYRSASTGDNWAASFAG